MKEVVFVTLVTFCAFTWNWKHVNCELSLAETKCGTLTCKSHQYCSNYDFSCKPCSNICDSSNHNYDASVCLRDCQDYLHDELYVRKGTSGDFSGDIQKLYSLATAAIILIIIVICILLGILGYKIYKWSQNNDIRDVLRYFKNKPDANENKTSSPNGITIANTKRDLRLDMPSPGTPSELSPNTLTTSISMRRPAEDSALDYAYDNPAMSATPSPNSTNNKPSRESNF